PASHTPPLHDALPIFDATRRSADRLSRTVLAALEDGMLRHDRSMMATIMGAMGEYDVVAGAWVLNDEGRLYVGTRPETVAARSRSEEHTSELQSRENL